MESNHPMSGIALSDRCCPCDLTSNHVKLKVSQPDTSTNREKIPKLKMLNLSSHLMGQRIGLATKLVQINTPNIRNNLDTLTNATASSLSLQVRLPAKQHRPWLRTTARTTPSSTSPPNEDPRIPEASATAAPVEDSTGTIKVAMIRIKNFTKSRL